MVSEKERLTCSKTELVPSCIGENIKASKTGGSLVAFAILRRELHHKFKASDVNLIRPAPEEMATRRRSLNSEAENSFIAIMRDDLHAKNLRVPPQFMKYLSGDLTDHATLITHSTACWEAAIARTEETIYFKGGWENLFKDHSLGHEELLVFTYKGNMHFHVQVFGTDRCPRNENARPQVQRQLPVTAESFTSSFPHFKICLRKSSFQPFYLLSIPTTADMILNLPRETTDFIMRCGGRVWDVKCLWNTAGPHRFSKGWRSFVHDNELKPGDTCVFELVDTYELRVTIFRC